MNRMAKIYAENVIMELVDRAANAKVTMARRDAERQIDGTRHDSEQFEAAEEVYQTVLGEVIDKLLAMVVDSKETA